MCNSRRFDSILVAWLLAVLLAAPFPAAHAQESWQPYRTEPPSMEEWDRLSDWQQLFWWRPIRGHREIALPFLEEVIARSPNDFVAHLLAGQALASLNEASAQESTSVAAVIAEAIQRANDDPTPEHWARVAGIRVPQRDEEAWQFAIGRAIQVAEAAGRLDDAFFGAVVQFYWRIGPRDRELDDANLREVRRLAERTGSPVHWAEYQLHLGAAMFSRNFQDSLAPRQEALALLEQHAPGTQLHARALIDLADTHRRLSQADEAIPKFEAGIRMAAAVDDPRLEAAGHQGLGQLIRREGDAVGALEHYEQARELLALIRDDRRVAMLGANLRPLMHQLGRYGEARQCAIDGLELCRREGLGAELPFALDGMGSEEALLGRLDAARQLFEEAISSAKAGGHRVPVSAYVHLATLLNEIEDYEGSVSVIEEGLELARSKGNSWGEFFLEHVLTTALSSQGRHEEALANTDSLLDPERPIDGRSRVSAARSRAGNLAALGRYEEALALCDSLIGHHGQGGEDAVELARNLQQKTFVLLQADRPEEALVPSREALELLQETGDRSLVHVMHLEYGQALSRAGRAAEARSHLEKGLARIEEIHSGLTVGEERTGFFSRWYLDYVALADACLQGGDHDAVFRTLERGRAREMRRALQAGRSGVQAHVGAETAIELARLEEELYAVQTAQIERLSSDERSADLDALEARADDLKRRRSELVRDVEREEPAFARAAGWLPAITLAEFQSQLTPGQLVLATMVGETQTLVFEIERSAFRGRSIPWGEEELGERVSRITDGLQGGNESWEATADELGGALLPGLPVAGATKAVFVLADGPLHRLPFEVLPIGGKGGPLLIQAADVAYESSATLLAERLAAMVADRSASRPSACRLLAFGDPATAGSAASVESGTRGGLPTLRALPHAREEVAHLSRLIEGTCVRVGEQATEAEFFRESPSASVIHLAAHAYVDDRHPGYSGIVLASEGAEDGIVQGFEVLRSDLRADLVTLSACDTGRGRWSRGEGLIGLSRAFRIAGARSLVVSLWQVNDEATSEFMGRFYERLLEGQSLAAALRATKQSFREEAWEGGSDGDVTRGLGRRTRDSTARTPGWWSAFVLLGPGASPYR